MEVFFCGSSRERGGSCTGCSKPMNMKAFGGTCSQKNKQTINIHGLFSIHVAQNDAFVGLLRGW